jgi:hypothetical protein
MPEEVEVVEYEIPMTIEGCEVCLKTRIGSQDQEVCSVLPKQVFEAPVEWGCADAKDAQTCI